MIQQTGEGKQDSEQLLVQNSEDSANCGSEVKPNLSLERSDHGGGVLSDGDSSIKADYFVMEKSQAL